MADRKYARRVAFLKALPADVLASLPSASEDVTLEKSAALDLVVRDMVAAGLYSHRHTATRWGIRVLVSELRGTPVNHGIW